MAGGDVWAVVARVVAGGSVTVVAGTVVAGAVMAGATVVATGDVRVVAMSPTTDTGRSSSPSPARAPMMSRPRTTPSVHCAQRGQRRKPSHARRGRGRGGTGSPSERTPPIGDARMTSVGAATSATLVGPGVRPGSVGTELGTVGAAALAGVLLRGGAGGGGLSSKSEGSGRGGSGSRLCTFCAEMTCSVHCCPSQ